MANQENALLDRLDRFCDAVPRAAARPEELGDYVLFVRKEEAGWPFYARPRVGVTAPPAAADITTVRARQRELGLPESFGWIHEINPDLLAVARSAGLGVRQAPLMVLDPTALPPVDRFADRPVRLLDPDSFGFAADLTTWFTIAQAAFGPSGGTGTGLPTVGADAPEIVTVTFPTVDNGGPGVGAPDPAGQPAPASGGLATAAPPAPTIVDPALPDALVEHERSAIADGSHTIALAGLPAGGQPAAVGSLNRVDDVAEIVGVGTVAPARRQGLASAVTAALARHALATGVDLIFLAAGDDDVAMLYHRLGFRRVGTSCVAEPTAHPGG
ncbi:MULTISPECIES: GNAT family N-acetyltransferase [unclassified Solwaraspora]|uniref:GNAT family N-acetyltransferase n=1 Tax=unclassified Solwaraspora TaxID=2627926 RepID=UPI00248AC22E|nr:MULTISPECIES: GNAT family N-acetyltransferase [unclassified Solwaraspora]WBB94927.1 GNAT family N-acetyltransferase [Solwaraspora sp. WMMA2059]WBC21190.1 GNAT family N-acetyltransferase [Solwaraspora sp. WMMA2080]WJK36728.1 GNAT family N-acetyltransferase [Solwaraspora sp. WMMA2065]